MPAAIREHVRYPEDIFAIQAQVYATYHMTQPAVFYNREDQWEIPTIDDGERRGTRCSRTTRSCGCPARRTPSSSRCCRSRRGGATTWRRGSWRAATASTTAGCGVFEFPKQKLVFGPRQVVARIAQDQAISPQITLWNQQGSQVIWGTLMVIPDRGVADLRAAAVPARAGRTHPRADARHRRLREPDRDGADARRGSRAALRRPLRVSRDRRRRRILARLAAPTTPAAGTGARPAPSQRLPALAAEAQRHYERAVQAQRAGDWATYGEELRQLGQVSRAHAPRGTDAPQADARIRRHALQRLADPEEREDGAGRDRARHHRAATGERDFELYGSGRTDAGVHALAQVAHLDIHTTMPPETLRRRINDELPADINILLAEKVRHKFHARHDAVGRTYIYQVSRRRTAFAKPLCGG